MIRAKKKSIMYMNAKTYFWNVYGGKAFNKC